MDINVRLKPQRPTFETDQLDTSIDDLSNDGSDGNNDSNSSTNAPPNGHPDKVRPPPIASVDVDQLLITGIDNLESLKDLKQIESMALFKRLVDDLLILSDLVKKSPDLDLRSILFGKMGSNLVVREEFDDDNGSVESEEFVIYPPLIADSIAKLREKKRSTPYVELEQFKTKSTEELEVPLRKNSRIDSNFGALLSGDLTDEELRPVAGSYHINIDYSLCEQIVQKFYLKQVPALTISKYLERINRFLTPSPSVLITASYFLFNLAFNLRPENDQCVLPLQAPPESDGPIKMTYVDTLDVFRLILSVLRVSLKEIEDKNFKQAYYCKITGLQHVEDLLKLELSLLYLLDFHIFINEFTLTRFVFQFRVFDRNLHSLLRADGSTEQGELEQ
ncbi:DEKNAAC101405 [Brettanomyces naardenensis]|uniref:DEKNAAC101405 n=1 Tax=Brettanomyces naardenensis TaxID=13370 RepID=A0A448YI85_BRENA|nr:DEKNAAC101405 [Brettanomyces naardenensis]